MLGNLRQPLYSRSAILYKYNYKAALVQLKNRNNPLPTALSALAKDSACFGYKHNARGIHASSRKLAPDYYSILGASPSDSADEIKKKYRKLAKQYHPDTSSEADAKDKFQQVSEAWECLKDDKERSLYDAYGHNGYVEYKKSGGAGPQPGGADGINLDELFRNMGGFGDIFGDRGRAQTSGPRRGKPVQVRVDLSFFEAINGCVKDFAYRAAKQCESCQGKGTEKGYAPEYAPCSACNGRGTRQAVLGGVMHIEQVCEVCQGAGQALSNRCSTCSGSGLETAQKTTTIDIPPGVDTGMQMSQPGAGNHGELGGPPGDLIINIHVASDAKFVRDGLDIRYECPITLAQSILGDTISVPTISGDVEMVVTPSTANGEIRRLRGKGVPQVNNTSFRGDQYVKFKVVMPENLSVRQRELILEFEKEELEKEGQQVRPPISEDLKDALNRIKNSLLGCDEKEKAKE